MKPLEVISLFAGIGGIDLGLERAGMKCVTQVEIDDYATRVLEKHWPNTLRFRDVRECGSHNLPYADVIAGGFPCQDVSVAGNQAGLDGARSGLWSEYLRIIRELQPRYVFVENVPNLLVGDNGRWFGRVLGDLAESGYDAEWSVLSACAVGAPHTRERVFLVAYPSESGSVGRRICADGSDGARKSEAREWSQCAAQVTRSYQVPRQWATQSGIQRMAHGVPRRMDRIGAVGNAVVPYLAELVGRMIVAHAARYE